MGFDIGFHYVVAEIHIARMVLGFLMLLAWFTPIYWCWVLSRGYRGSHDRYDVGFHHVIARFVSVGIRF